MGPDRSHRAGSHRSRGLPLAATLCLALGLAAIARANAPTPTTVAAESGRLSSSAAASAGLGQRLAPEAGGLAHSLPAVLSRLESLREPTATTEEQLRVALGQLQQMSILGYDPHYLPALLAVGRAYLAATGSDPPTATAVDPEYAGLGREIAHAHSDLHRSAARATRLSHEVKSLSRELVRQKRRAARLAGALQAFDNRAGRPRS